VLNRYFFYFEKSNNFEKKGPRWWKKSADGWFRKLRRRISEKQMHDVYKSGTGTVSM
jgi:hypothetical protein